MARPRKYHVNPNREAAQVSRCNRRLRTLRRSFIGSILVDYLMSKGCDVQEHSIVPAVRITEFRRVLPDVAFADLRAALEDLGYVRFDLRRGTIKVLTAVPKRRKALGILNKGVLAYDEMAQSLVTAGKYYGVKQLRNVEQAGRDVDAILKEHLAEFGTLSDADRILYNKIREGIEESRSEAIDLLVTVESAFEGSQA